jgi:hypothetical protein
MLLLILFALFCLTDFGDELSGHPREVVAGRLPAGNGATFLPIELQEMGIQLVEGAQVF